MEEIELNIGKTTIPYKIVESPRSSRNRLILTAETMEVRVAKGTTTLDIRAFLESKEKWIIQSLDELRSKPVVDCFPHKFAPGSKIMKWGRFVRLEFKKTDTDKVKAYGGAPIWVEIPMGSSFVEHESEVADAITLLLTKILKVAIAKLIEKYAGKLPAPKAWSISRSSNKWGYCSADGRLGFNWQLVCFPKSILEYVVVHELAHLAYRNHSDDFWALVGSILPSYKSQKQWLEIDGIKFR